MKNQRSQENQERRSLSQKILNPSRLQLIVSILFCILMVAVTTTRVVYVPISQERVLDLSLIPVMFAAMIGGYRVAIPLAIGWAFLSYMNLGSKFTWEWLLIVKATFAFSCVYHYNLFKKAYPRSPANVYRAIIATVILKAAVTTMGNLAMFSNTQPSLWLRDSIIQGSLELALCLLSMMLLIKHLRQIHILNGVKKKGEKVDEHTNDVAH